MGHFPNTISSQEDEELSLFHMSVVLMFHPSWCDVFSPISPSWFLSSHSVFRYKIPPSPIHSSHHTLSNSEHPFWIWICKSNLCREHLIYWALKNKSGHINAVFLNLFRFYPYFFVVASASKISDKVETYLITTFVVSFSNKWLFQKKVAKDTLTEEKDENNFNFTYQRSFSYHWLSMLNYNRDKTTLSIILPHGRTNRRSISAPTDGFGPSWTKLSAYAQLFKIQFRYLRANTIEGLGVILHLI